MNFTNILIKQKKLDQALASKIKELNPNLESTNHERQKMLALMIECSEFANEIQSFKYWKKNKNISRDNALEEFADVLHFIGSFANDYNVERIVEPQIISQDFNVQLTQCFVSITEAMKNINKQTIYNIFSLCLGMAKLCKFTEEEIELWYNKKNLTNYQRITNNY
ncbi:dUTP diphosphatase [Mycoplasma crocodyli]|uniref:dUTP diphosphatase n=1 Tax=Mycoplasma crocodyli (strain ATCC 51981 / MP145) TaxID=512564 RepID=D5E5D3_MYCCM|nr:dUTP diphosphatase [Mycoplasma crocodyli]ADE19801.1 dUTP diphosphatase [Mycoplasma crocodyli MP145]